MYAVNSVLLTYNIHLFYTFIGKIFIQIYLDTEALIKFVHGAFDLMGLLKVFYLARIGVLCKNTLCVAKKIKLLIWKGCHIFFLLIMVEQIIYQQ